MKRIMLAAMLLGSAVAVTPPANAQMLPVDSLVIFAPPDGAEPIRVNATGWDCSTYTWNVVTREYHVWCTSTGAACGLVRVTAMGVPFTVFGASECVGGMPAMAVAPGVGVASGGPSPWHCYAAFLLPIPTGYVECSVMA